MIINVRGTHGSGKSHLVRSVISHYDSQTEVMMDGRKQPIGNVLRNGEQKLYIPGHYRGPCGGTDSITAVETTYHLIAEYADQGYDVLYEGILAQHSTPNIVKLHKDGNKVLVIAIKIRPEDAVEAVRQRRIARGDDKPLNPVNILREARAVENSLPRLRSAGIETVLLSREDALQACLERLNLC